METPKLGVASIIWLNFYLTKTRVLRAGRAQIFDCVRPALSTRQMSILLHKSYLVKCPKICPHGL